MADCVLVSQLQRGLFCLAKSNAKWEISAFSVKKESQNINACLEQYETLHIKDFCALFTPAIELTESVAGFLSYFKAKFCRPKTDKACLTGGRVLPLFH